jgi:uncharacterized protein (TIGR02246 family)
MATSNQAVARTSDESEIRKLMEEWREAISARDLDRLMKLYAPDMLYFDVVPPYKHRGAAAYRRTWEMMFPHLPPRIGAEQRDVEINVSGDLAVVRCLTRLINSETKETAAIGWVRVTVSFQRQQGAWRIIHEHVSVPIDPMTSKAEFIREP